MRKHHPKNERIKRRYLAYLEEAKRQSPASVDQAAAAIAQFEASTRWRDFARFHIEQARAFKRELAAQRNAATGKPLAKATIHSRLMALKAFFHWLAGQSGYRRISYSDVDYFNPSANDSRVATARREKPAPSIDQVRHVVNSIAIENDIDRRDRALIAFALLSGARDDAIASLALRHVDTERRTVFQDARCVRTKNRKTFTSWFFPVGDDIEAIVTDWIAHLKCDLLFGPDDPLFPATRVALDHNGYFGPAGVDRTFWKSADAIRRIFRQRFAAAGLPYFNPHSLRTTLARLGEKVCQSPEAFKAWSQNLGHEQVLTTFTSYGAVASHRQAEIFDALRRHGGGLRDGAPDAATIQHVLDHLRENAG
ncbi:tyrosine-type recombinase/integrase [Nitratireductor mangrovi]|uniref:Tyrosine-type recombinase/integrase n=1 Tax=Nitratireductor mangrovi TaxID=2599600 RepID=A0A5B8KWM4_9HYPH|nr:tyrosine-type recombinase/integrase [Nitratireductor mangrovi]QDZ00117.1 tyrosine-type recombinase/integrase [Nitratireductor mangrovi]